MATCVANLLEMNVDEVPNFAAEQHWWLSFSEWLNTKGFSAILVDMRLKGMWSYSNAHVANAHCIAIGESPQGAFDHAVIGKMCGLEEPGKQWELIHDPHPDGTGLASDPKYFIFLASNEPWK